MAKEEVETTGMEHVINAAKAAVGAEGRIAVYKDVVPYVHEGGRVHVAQDVLDAYEARRDVPLRRMGTTNLTELGSFVAFVNRYKHATQSIAFADVERFAVTAIFNAAPLGDDLGAAGWADHRAVYTCPRSPEWIAWTAVDGKAMGQEAFGDFIEQRLEDLAEGDGYPKPAAVLEMARNLVIRQAGQFKRQINKTTGEGILISETAHGSETTPIHRAFLLGIRVFEGGDRHAVEARVRFAMNDGRPSFGVVLHRRAEIERDAFGDVRKVVGDSTELQVFAGPAPGRV